MANEPVATAAPDPIPGGASKATEFALSDLTGGNKPPEGSEEIVKRLEQAENYLEKLKGEKGTEHDMRLKAETRAEALERELREFKEASERKARGEEGAPPTLEEMFRIDDEKKREFDDHPVKGLEWIATTMSQLLEQRDGNYAKALAYLQQSAESKVGSTKQELEKMLSEMRNQLDPNITQWKPEIEALRKNPVFASLDDGTLIEIAKASGKNKPAMTPRGDIGGHATTATAASKEDVKELLEGTMADIKSVLGIGLSEDDVRGLAARVIKKRHGITITGV